MTHNLIKEYKEKMEEKLSSIQKELPDHTKKDRNERARNRIRLAEVMCALLPVGFMAVFGSKYLIKPAVDPDSAAVRNTIIYDEISKYAIEGDIIDRNGNTILGYGEPGIGAYANAPENYSYAYLLGYYTVNSNHENMYGLRGHLKDYSLFHLDENNKGASTYLTTDTALQDFAYTDLLNGQEGSITVLDNKTGEILCLASQSTIDYDVNDTNAFVSDTTPDGQFRRGTYENDPPGSTFKVITAAAALTMMEEEGLGDDFLHYYDTGTFTPQGDSWTISNYQNEVFGDCELNEAMRYSINCYFANLGIQVGADRLNDMAARFMIGQDIEIPFLCTLHSSIDIENDTPATIAQTAFGQSNTEITPLHMAMIAQAVANKGVMMQPYIVSSIKSGRRSYYTIHKKKLSETMSLSVNDKLKTAMHEAAMEYGFNEQNYGMVYAKTGTAECANDRIHCYMIGFTDSVSFCISFNTMRASAELYDEALRLISWLNQNGY